MNTAFQPSFPATETSHDFHVNAYDVVVAPGVSAERLVTTLCQHSLGTDLSSQIPQLIERCEYVRILVQTATPSCTISDPCLTPPFLVIHRPKDSGIPVESVVVVVMYTIVFGDPPRSRSRTPSGTSLQMGHRTSYCEREIMQDACMQCPHPGRAMSHGRASS